MAADAVGLPLTGSHFTYTREVSIVMSSEALPRGYELQDYSIESVLGTGGFGITYLAHDAKLGTRVAIKEYFPQDLARRDERMGIAPKPGAAAETFEWGRKQFLKEARALAQFKHNNIVRVLRFLELNGTAYMIMEYEKGQGLQDYIRTRGQPDERMLLQVFLPILNGLQAVHRAGLLHLDIKPDNIYLRADGPPMLIDFGSARQVARGAETAGPVALTPAYAAIEQYRDQARQGPWTDVYAIGASLYRCISGVDPVDALTRYEAMQRDRSDPLTPATALPGAGYSAYLRECVDWAMQLDPAQRPQSAVALQDALMGKGHPQRKPAPPIAVSAAPDAPAADAVDGSGTSDVRRFDRWKLTQAALAAAVVLGLAVVLVSYLVNHESAPPVPVAVTATSEVAAPAAAPTTPAVSEDTGSASRLAGQTGGPVFAGDKPIRLVRTISAHRDTVQTLTFLDHGGQLVSAGADGDIKIWDVASGQLLRTLKGHRRSVNAVAVSPDGKLLASAGNERDVFLWDPASGKRLGALAGHSYDVYALAFSPDGRWLASAGRDHSIILWDLNTRRLARRFAGHDDSVLSLAFAPGSDWLLSGGEHGDLKRWSVATGNELDNLASHRGQPILAVGVSPDGKWFASAGSDNQIRIWNADNDQMKCLPAESRGAANAFVFTPDGRQLVAAGADHSLRVWDVTSCTLDLEVPGPGGDIQAIALSADTRTVATGGSDKLVRIWNATAR